MEIGWKQQCRTLAEHKFGFELITLKKRER